MSDAGVTSVPVFPTIWAFSAEIVIFDGMIGKARALKIHSRAATGATILDMDWKHQRGRTLAALK